MVRENIFKGSITVIVGPDSCIIWSIAKVVEPPSSSSNRIVESRSCGVM
jgi:hypothetical protein